jgi:hypothetical protein
VRERPRWNAAAETTHLHTSVLRRKFDMPPYDLEDIDEHLNEKRVTYIASSMKTLGRRLNRFTLNTFDIDNTIAAADEYENLCALFSDLSTGVKTRIEAKDAFQNKPELCMGLYLALEALRLKTMEKIHTIAQKHTNLKPWTAEHVSYHLDVLFGAD